MPRLFPRRLAGRVASRRPLVPIVGEFIVEVVEGRTVSRRALGPWAASQLRPAGWIDACGLGLLGDGPCPGPGWTPLYRRQGVAS
jgi:hypothetical protein